MPLPRVAIVGRPNVGKSSLVNMIAGSKVSIVDPTPGVTRDRVSAIVQLDPPVRGQQAKSIELIDTGGYGVYTREGAQVDDAGHDLSKLTEHIEHQIAEAVASADLILFAVDCQAGITPSDLRIAQMLREQKLGSRRREHAPRIEGERPDLVPVAVIATKCDGPKWEAHAYELSALGFGDVLPCSAKNNYLKRELLDRLWETVPQAQRGDAPPLADLKIAIIGKRNAGKSTLINTLAGEQRVIVSEIPGTTRDAIDVRFEMGDRSLMAIDTAGLRRKKSMDERVEWYAYDRLQRAIDRADVVLLLIDGTDKISQVDEQLAMLVQKAYKPCVVVVNKWDLIEGQRNERGKQITPDDYELYLRKELKGLAFAPVAMMSSATGLNVQGVVELAFELHDQASQRVGTGELNRLVRDILDRQGPANKLGTFAKVYYATQTSTNPPTIVLVVNRPKLFTPNYTRYILNRFREALPFSEVPIRLIIKSRSARDVEQQVADLAQLPQPSRGAVKPPRPDLADRYFDEPSLARSAAPTGDQADLDNDSDEQQDIEFEVDQAFDGTDTDDEHRPAFLVEEDDALDEGVEPDSSEPNADRPGPHGGPRPKPRPGR